MNNLTTFYIVRHGQTEFNVKRIIQGHVDSPLTEEGILQIKKLAHKFKDHKFDLAFSSDLLRAKRTAEIIALEHKLAVETTELLRERSWGKYDGKSGELLKTYDELFQKLTDEEKFRFAHEDIESYDKLMARIITFLRETAITHPGKKILVGTHGTVLRILLIHLGYGTYQTLPSRSVDNLAWVKLETDGVDFYIKETEGVNRHKI